ncbi:MAG TPA: hypothetical protein PLG79_09525, partial [Spirochaetales bacterium]|nr:hypothetical protein [Spirochaetales bacterium]
MKREKVGFTLILFLISILLPAEEVGEVTYLENSVMIQRNNAPLKADFGTPVENYDLIKTGSTGLAEVQIDPSIGIEGSLIVKPSSHMYIELSLIEKGGKIRAELLSGSVSQKALKLAGKSSFEVRTGNVSMGVRGTT